MVLAAAELRGGIERTQSVSLRAGWNAVYLEVDPPRGDPDELFRDTPVDVVATTFSSPTLAQFMTNPQADILRQYGWGVWYAPGRPDAFLGTLHAIHGAQAYLIHAKSDYTWALRGPVLVQQARWIAGAYNFVGFGVASQGAPSFAEFFAGSSAHAHNRVYRLKDGAWRQVTQPAAEAMVSGEAFWIYCDGASGYQGPLRVITTTNRGVVLGAAGDDLLLRNDTVHPLQPAIEHVAGGADAVPLAIAIQVVGDPSAPLKTVAAPKPAADWAQDLPPLEAGESVKVPFLARMEEMVFESQGSLLKITTDIGTETWIPVVAVREDLEVE